MAKSLGNFFTLRDLMSRGYNGREVRYVLLSSHYRETFNFSFDGLDGARAALGRLDECVAKLTQLAAGAVSEPDSNIVDEVTAALDEDLNIAAAWGLVFVWVRDLNRKLADRELTPAQAAGALAAWVRLDRVFGLNRPAEAAAPPEVVRLLEERQAARKARDFKQSDLLRDAIKAAGWVIEDTPQGAKLKKA